MMYGYGWSFTWPMMIGMLLFWVIIIGLIVFGIIEIIKRIQGTESFRKTTNPREIAKIRFAKGEITKKQFEEIIKELKKEI